MAFTQTPVVSSDRLDKEFYDGPIVRHELASAGPEPKQVFKHYANYDDFCDRYRSVLDSGKPFAAHEVIQPRRVQRIRFDIDVPIEAILSPTPQVPSDLGPLIALLIECTRLVYQHTYYAEHVPAADEFVIMNSHGTKKLSVHILAPIYCVTAAQCVQFLDFVRLETEIRYEESGRHPRLFLQYVDWGVVKPSVNNLRMPFACKFGDASRPKIWDDADVGAQMDFSEALVGWYEDHLPRYYVDTQLSAPIASHSTASTSNRARTLAVEALLNTYFEGLPVGIAHSFAKTWRLGSESANVLYYLRRAASFCVVCRRIHETDNTLFVTIAKSAKANVTVRCRRQSDGGVIIGQISTDVVAESVQQRIAKMTKRIAGPTPPPADHRERLNMELGRQQFRDHEIFRESDAALRDFPDVRTLFVRAPMMMGKTAKIVDLIRSRNPRTILYVSFRQTFSAAIVPRLNQDLESLFVSYTAIEGAIHADIYPRVVIQVESLHRLRSFDFDLIVLDEVESILDQLTSPFVQNCSTTYALFQSLLRGAHSLVCMDANLGERTLRLIGDARPPAGRNGLVTLGERNQRLFYENTARNCSDRTMEIVSSSEVLYGRLEEAVRAGKRCFVASSSLSEAKAIMQALQNQFAGQIYETTKAVDRLDAIFRGEVPKATKKVAIYTGETGVSIRQHHFADVNRAWGVLDVLIFTPTVTAGVSFDLDYFDIGFGVFKSTSCSVETCRQMLGRVRRLRESRYVVYLDAAEMNLPTRWAEVGRILLNTWAVQESGLLRHGADTLPSPTIANLDESNRVVVTKNNHFDLSVANLIHTNLSRNNFYRRFLEQVRETGVVITYADDADQFMGVFEKSKLLKQVADTRATEVAEAAALPHDTYLDVMKRQRGIGGTTTMSIDDALLAQAKKRAMMVTYYLDGAEERIDKTFVLDYGAETTQSQFRHLHALRETLAWRDLQPTRTIAVYLDYWQGTAPLPTVANSRTRIALVILKTLGLAHFGNRLQMTKAEFDVASDSISDWLRGLAASTQVSPWHVIHQAFGFRRQVRSPLSFVAGALDMQFGMKLVATSVGGTSADSDTVAQKMICLHYTAKLMDIVAETPPVYDVVEQ